MRNSQALAPNGVARLPTAVEQGLTTGGEDRGVLIFRRIAHHYGGSNGRRVVRLYLLSALQGRPRIPIVRRRHVRLEQVRLTMACFPTWTLLLMRGRRCAGQGQFYSETSNVIPICYSLSSRRLAVQNGLS